jgi:transcription-repair coupling factor (superfamily II helicase)
VQSIEYEAGKLKEALPQVRMAVAHGQMAEGELEKVFVRFMDREIDVLVCSAIIESGLDIANVNTILINDADHFGLSQLYQLRGRVGRSSVQAYAWLLVRSLSGLTADARKRLKTLEQLTEFGSGFQIAMRDLEIRGAGNMLGVRQHGLMSLIGFEMVQNLMKEALQEIREKKKVMQTDPAVRIEGKAFIPSAYIEDGGLRLEIYQRLSAVESVSAIDDIGVEMADRFGVVPPEAEALLDVIALKFLAGRLCALSVSVKAGLLILEMDPKSLPSPGDWALLMKKLPQGIDIRYEEPIAIRIPLPQRENPLKAGKNVLLSMG